MSVPSCRHPLVMLDQVHNPCLTTTLKREALRSGFTQVGVCAAVRPTGIDHFRDWLAAGYAGEMRYLADRAEAYQHPGHVLEGVRSIVMLAMNYHTGAPAPLPSGAGRVGSYAWGDDYHDLIRQRLNRLAEIVKQESPGATVRGVVDTAPLLEREFAQLAGLGWIGKNTLLLNPQLGSYFFLAALLTDVELKYDQPFTADHCGECRACLDACPTRAFVAPRVLDSRRCISYLTIELRGPIPSDLREPLGDWLFGCDICQDVCPWNGRVPHSLEPSFQPAESPGIELAQLFYLSDQAFRERFRASPLWRSRRRGILRNAAIVLGNQRAPETIDALAHGLHDAESIVRGACGWALGRFSEVRAREALHTRQAVETDESVLSEIDAALRCQGRAD